MVVGKDIPTIDYRNPAGEPSLVPPGSPQWRVFKNPVALAVGGVAAVLLEFADPRIRSGVWDHSTFKDDPLQRSQRTLTAALLGVYGPESQARAVIAKVNRLHENVRGQTPDGQSYSALDPELLDWVALTAAYGFLNAYHHFVAPLSDAEKRRYYTDGKVVARLYGARTQITSNAEFLAELDRRLPQFEAHPITFEFLAIVQSGKTVPLVPKFAHRALARAAVSLLPPVVRARLQLGPEFDLTLIDKWLVSGAAKLADKVRSRNSPAWQAALRLGLPGDFAWRDANAQRQLLAANGLADARRYQAEPYG